VWLIIQRGPKKYTPFNVQNIWLNNLLIYLRFNFANVRRWPLPKCVIEVIYGHFQNWTEDIPRNHLSRYFVRWGVQIFLGLFVYTQHDTKNQNFSILHGVFPKFEVIHNPFPQKPRDKNLTFIIFERVHRSLNYSVDLNHRTSGITECHFPCSHWLHFIFLSINCGKM
jgi:hypothetical protein